MAIPSIEEWRNNRNMLDYHRMWHRNFPWSQRWNTDGAGAEFLHFHRQFIAWYNVERIARGLSLVPDWDLDQPIPDAHTNENGVTRPGNYRIPRTQQASYAVPSWFTSGGGTDAYENDSRSPNGPTQQYKKLADFPDVDTLGKALESPWHNMGHGVMGNLFSTGPFSPGDMSSTGRAPRDPFFFIWHRRIDNIWRVWSELAQVPLPQVPPLPIQLRDGSNPNGTDSPDIVIRRSAIPNAEAELGDFDILDLQTDEVMFGQSAYLYARVENPSPDPVTGRVHFFYTAISMTNNRRYWVELPPSNARRWGTGIQLGPGKKQVVTSGPMPGAVVWEPLFIPAPGVYRLLAMVVPENAPPGYPFDRAIPGGALEDYILQSPWMAWRDFRVVEQT